MERISKEGKKDCHENREMLMHSDASAGSLA
jgi:hypothetical protein